MFFFPKSVFVKKKEFICNSWQVDYFLLIDRMNVFWNAVIIFVFAEKLNEMISKHRANKGIV